MYNSTTTTTTTTGVPLATPYAQEHAYVPAIDTTYGAPVHQTHPLPPTPIHMASYSPTGAPAQPITSTSKSADYGHKIGKTLGGLAAKISNTIEKEQMKSEQRKYEKEHTHLVQTGPAGYDAYGNPVVPVAAVHDTYPPNYAGAGVAPLHTTNHIGGVPLQQTNHIGGVPLQPANHMGGVPLHQQTVVPVVPAHSTTSTVVPIIPRSGEEFIHPGHASYVASSSGHGTVPIIPRTGEEFLHGRPEHHVNVVPVVTAPVGTTVYTTTPVVATGHPVPVRQPVSPRKEPGFLDKLKEGFAHGQMTEEQRLLAREEEARIAAGGQRVMPPAAYAQAGGYPVTHTY